MSDYHDCGLCGYQCDCGWDVEDCENCSDCTGDVDWDDDDLEEEE